MKVNANSLVQVSRVCEYIPVISGFAALGELIARAILKGVEAKNLSNDRYYEHITNKELWRILVLLIPVIGTVIVAIYNAVYNAVLAAVKQNGLALQHATCRLKNDSAVVLPAVSQNGMALQYASAWLRADDAVIEAAKGNNPEADRFALGIQSDVTVPSEEEEGEFFFSSAEYNLDLPVPNLEQDEDDYLLENEMTRSDHEKKMKILLNRIRQRKLTNV